VVVKIFARGGNKEEAAPAEDEVDRTREIQDEIRRRILDRQQEQGEGGGPVAAPAQPRRLQPQMQPPPVQQAAPAPAQPSLYQGPTNQEMEAQAIAVAATQAQREQKLRKIQNDHARGDSLRKVAAEGAARRTLAAALAVRGRAKHNRGLRSLEIGGDPAAVRKAFVYMEVLSAPVALRENSSLLHFWEQ
jgi:hypothetical protein